jgi:outer membrane receptor for ferrienterochelin and colicin
MNRWEVKGSRFESQFIVKGLLEQRDAGQLNFSNEDKGTTRNYGIGVNTKRIEAIAKTGIFLNEANTNSIAVIASGFFHKQDGFYGLKTYVGQQGNFFANVMYQGIVNNTNHNIVTGLSLMYDQYDETINGQLLQRQFIIPGAFGEYTYNYLDKFSIVAGLRLDIPHQYKVQLNPRLHLKYAPGKGATFRVSAGRGFRIPNVYAENSFVFASSRHWMIEENPTYEVAWNSGISYMQTFKIAQRTSSFQVDYFRTQFMKNVIVDIDNRSNMAMVYNIGKGSYSNSLLLEWNVSPLEGLDIKVAYKWEDVKLLQKEGLLRKSMLSPQRGLLVIGYKTKDDKWMFNTQWSLHGKHRLPISFDGNLQQFSPVYAIGGLQVTRYQKAFEFFVGVENLLNTRQSNPITGASDPFGANFDTYQVWGPVVGVIGFGGIRAKI